MPPCPARRRKAGERTVSAETLEQFGPRPSTAADCQPDPASAWVYMVRCADGSLYSGWTNDLARRLRAHKGGKAGAKDKKDEEPKERKPPSKNGGRRPRSDFKAAETVKLPHTEMHVGQLCPCGCGGRLYLWKDRCSHFRHFVGQAPIKVTLYERDILKCNNCDST